MCYSKLVKLFSVGVICVLLSACFATMPSVPEPQNLVAPEPIEDNSGEYLSPYTSDDVVAPWVEKGMAAKVGAVAGSLATQKAVENIPFANYFADSIGSAIGRRAALEMVGGTAYMKKTTDLSFNSIDDLVVYTYVRHSSHPDYSKVIDLIGNIYPDIKSRYHAILIAAPQQEAMKKDY